MATVSRGLPERPHLDIPKREARELLDAWRAAQPEALERVRRRHPKFEALDDAAIATAKLKLADAQQVIAGEYGLANWTMLKRRIESYSLTGALERAIHSNRCEKVVQILTENPHLIDVPVWSGNWGPPMSHAANLGRLEIIQAVAELGARDYQHAFDRALLQGQIECARWLHAHGAKLAPGIIMGSCETQNASGFKFLVELGAPLTNEHGDRLAPLALVLETYCRNTEGKHEILGQFARLGYDLPDTPMMALHRGDIAALERHLHRDPRLLERRFTLREIFPPELGCLKDGRSGMHWTPIDGTTLLHVAIDFREKEIFEWLLAHGAEVNARATVDAEGFGGHTPLFNAIVNGPWRDSATTRALLERGASPEIRASVRKFLDWCEKPRWHEARNATATEWGRTFPDQGWVNQEALEMLDASSAS